MKEMSENLLAQFSSMPTQSMDSFMLKFDFLGDDSVKIKGKEKSCENIETEVEHKAYEENKELIQTDEIEEIDLKKVETSRSGFWNCSQRLVMTKFDTFINEEESQNNDFGSNEADEFIKDYIRADSYSPSVKGEMKSVEIKEDIDKIQEDSQLTLNDHNKGQKTNLETESEDSSKGFDVYPGEIVEEKYASSIDTKCNQTKLDIYSVKKDDFESEYVIINGDTVEKFELDPNFNYSEHIYTPRYNFN